MSYEGHFEVRFHKYMLKMTFEIDVFSNLLFKIYVGPYIMYIYLMKSILNQFSWNFVSTISNPLATSPPKILKIIIKLIKV